MTRIDQHRRQAVNMLAAAGRVPLAEGGGVTHQLIQDICHQVGIHPHAFHVLFPDDDDFLDAVNELLVEQCVLRLRAGIEGFEPHASAAPDSQIAFTDAAVALAGSWPLDRGGMIIRAERRLRALRANASTEAVIVAERRFLSELVDVITELMCKLGRRFVWTPKLAVRVILDTYERSFETWLLTGHDEADFSHSPFVRRTLPTLLENLGVPEQLSLVDG